MVKKEISTRDIVLGNKRPTALSSLAQRYEIPTHELEATVKELQKEGYGIDISGDTIYRKHVDVQSEPVDLSQRFKKHFKFAVVSDTHFGNKNARVDALNTFYDIAQTEGCHDTFMCGDITDGVNPFQGSIQEQDLPNQDDQVDMVVREYPRRRGMVTRFITGNHDNKEYARGGSDCGKSIADQRDDLQYLGMIDRTVQMSEGGVTAELIHPAGNQAFSLSYKSQKDLQSRSEDDLPDLYMSGHFHQAWYGHFKGVEVLSVPSFKDNGLWERRLGLTGVVGGWVVEGKLNDEGTRIDRFRPELVTFRKR